MTAPAIGTTVQSASRPPVPSPSATGQPPDRVPRWALALSAALLVAICLAQAPGRLTSDTKLDLAVNPLRLLGRTLHLWDPIAGFGQLQNQAEGYLFPMGPFFAIARAVGLPTWSAQRLWIGLLLAIACIGTIRLADELSIGTPATRVAGGFAYALSPQLLVLLGPLSGLVLPVALVPWSIVPLVRGSRSGSPGRAAARSGVVVALMGAVNAGATLAVLALPALWLATRRAGPRRRALVLWWTAALGLACAWWLGALLVEGRYGFDFVHYIERAKATTATDSVPEAIRGTANWLAHYFFAGRPWWQGGWLLVAAPAAIFASAGLAAAGLAGLTSHDLAERRFLVLSLFLGVALTGAGYAGPLGGPFAQSVHRLLDGPLAVFRSFNKFGPLVALPLALGLAHGLASLRLTGRERPLTAALVALLLGGTALPLLRGEILPSGSFRQLPTYWSSTATWLAAHSGGGRAVLLPASGFGDYQWGRTVDEPLQPLASSPWAVRDQAPLGSTGLTRLLDGIEQRLTANRPTPGLAPVLARSGVRYLVVRNDLDWRRAGAPSPPQLRTVLGSAGGIRKVVSFGPRLTDAVTGGPLGGPFEAIDIYQVDGEVGRAVTYPGENTTILSGGPENLLQLADRNQLRGPVVLAGDGLQGLTPPADGLRWFDSDGLQRRNVDFGLVHGGASYVLGTHEPVSAGGAPQDRLPVEGTAHQTVAVMAGATEVRASSYATAIAAHPESQPMAAFDNDPSTAWQTGAAVSSDGEWVELSLVQPQAFPNVTVRLLDPGPGAPRPTHLRLTTDSGSLDSDVSDTEQPQVLRLPPGPTRRVRVTLLGVVNERHSASLARAGLREVGLPGLTVKRFLRVPGDELSRFAAPGSPAPVFAFDRSVGDPNQVLRGDEENRLARQFAVPTPVGFDVSGTVRADPGAGLDDLVRMLGADPASAGGDFSLPCGQGPVVRIDQGTVATSVHGTLADLRALRELPFSTCGGPVQLDAGVHRLETEPHAVLAVLSVTLSGAQGPSGPPSGVQGPTAAPAQPARATVIHQWDSTRRVVTIAPGGQSVLALDENFNKGWTATLGGHQLRAIRLDGWRQGWLVPEGAGGDASIVFGPDHAYRTALGIGGLGLVVLGFLASGIVFRRRSCLPAAATGGQRWLVAVVVGASLFVVGGPLALLAAVLLLIWRSARAPAVVAAGAFLCVGLVEVTQPSRPPGSHSGAFGWIAQLGAIIALAAVGVAAIRDPDTRAPGSTSPAGAPGGDRRASGPFVEAPP